MKNTSIDVPNISKAIMWTPMASTKPHLWYVKMILVQSQVSKWYFQTSNMKNTSMDVPNISKAIFAISLVSFEGGHMGPDDGYDLDIHASVLHEGGLECWS